MSSCKQCPHGFKQPHPSRECKECWAESAARNNREPARVKEAVTQLTPAEWAEMQAQFKEMDEGYPRVISMYCSWCGLSILSDEGAKVFHGSVYCSIACLHKVSKHTDPEPPTKIINPTKGKSPEFKTTRFSDD